MDKKLYISSYCSIKNNSIVVNGKPVYKEDNDISFGDFAKKIYKEEKIGYPKFFKMDSLCKLSFLAAEFVFQPLEKTPENTGIVFSNKASSLETDRTHQNSIQDKDAFYPSPAVFVYTLPNITIGEVSIRHQLKSENVFFVSEKINIKLFYDYVKILVGNKKSNTVLCGWVDFDNTNYEAFLYLVSDEGKIPHTIDNIQKIYNN